MSTSDEARAEALAELERELPDAYYRDEFRSKVVILTERTAKVAHEVLAAAQRPPVSPEDETAFEQWAANSEGNPDEGGGRTADREAFMAGRASRPPVSPEVREALARTLWIDPDYSWEYLIERATTGEGDYAEIRDGIYAQADAILARFSFPAPPEYDVESER